MDGFFGVGRVPFFFDGAHVSALAEHDWITLVEGFFVRRVLLNSKSAVLVGVWFLGLAFSDCGFDAVKSGVIDIYACFVLFPDLLINDVAVFLEREALIIINRYLDPSLSSYQFFLVVKL